MKKSTLLIIATSLMLSACGIIRQSADSGSNARFEDGIYSSAPEFRSKEERQNTKKDTDALIEKTRAAHIYLLGEKKDTVMIPENMSARIQFDKELGSTIVTVEESPYDWIGRMDIWPYYTPYSIGSTWYWSRHYNPWYWNTWGYTPWRYYGWYDPLYIGGWYDPWYYGYGGWYTPWYGYTYPYWTHSYPHHHGAGQGTRERWFGPRAGITGPRSIAGGTAVRSGITAAGRAATPTAVRVSRPAGGRNGAASVEQPRYRKPAAARTTDSYRSTGESHRTTDSYRSPGTQSQHRSSGYRSGDSYRSSDSYRSTPSPSRSSGYSSGGGAARSGGSGRSYGGRR